MKVWQDEKLNLKDELSKSEEVKKYLSQDELNEIFENKNMLKNVDYIFNRTILKEITKMKYYDKIIFIY